MYCPLPIAFCISPAFQFTAKSYGTQLGTRRNALNHPLPSAAGSFLSAFGGWHLGVDFHSSIHLNEIDHGQYAYKHIII